jgi:hypothetical protein
MCAGLQTSADAGPDHCRRAYAKGEYHGNKMLDAPSEISICSDDSPARRGRPRAMCAEYYVGGRRYACTTGYRPLALFLGDSGFPDHAFILGELIARHDAQLLR